VKIVVAVKRVLNHLTVDDDFLRMLVDEAKITANYNLVRWSTEHCLYRVQEALLGVLENLPMRPVAFLLSWAIFPLGARFRPPSTTC